MKFECKFVWQISVANLGYYIFGYLHNFGQIEKKHFETYFFAQMDWKKIGPNGCKVAEILDNVLLTESQNHRVKESHHFHSLIQVGEIFYDHF